MENENAWAVREKGKKRENREEKNEKAENVGH
jgi:hypothetical protein